MDGQEKGWMDRRTFEKKDGWMEGPTDGWMDEQNYNSYTKVMTDGWKDL